MSKQSKLKVLKEKALDCKLCGLCKSRTQVVFAKGTSEAHVMFVGEAPGVEEDRVGRPFVGKSGKLLGDMIGDSEITEKYDIYITNAVKCRPPDNRTPTEQEIETCLPYLEKQISIIKPLVIVTLGRVALRAVTGHDLAIANVRGLSLPYPGAHLIPTYHPAYVLRNPAARKDVVHDFEKALRLLERSLKRKGRVA